MFSFTKSRSRLRIENSRSRNRAKTGQLRNPGFLLEKISRRSISKCLMIFLDPDHHQWIIATPDPDPQENLQVKQEYSSLNLFGN